VAFAAVTALCLLVGGGYMAVAALRSEPPTSDAVVKRVRAQSPAVAVAAPAKAGTPARASAAPEVSAAPSGRVMVRAVDRDNPRLNGNVTMAGLAGDADPRAIGSLACQRVYYESGRGLCLVLASSGVDYEARIFDRRMRTVHELPLPGLPSRARVSPDGRYGSFTSFVAGDSYAATGAFSTRTVLLDMISGERIADLERFTVVQNGKTIDSPDFNFWGVTFARDSNTFYATLATGAHHFLVQGDIAERTVWVLRDGVECPSLSPDGTRIAFKSRIGEDRWRIQVLTLDGMSQTLLSETRSVDDQVEWLDGGWLAYGLDGDVWAARADGRGRPRRLLARADSPVALR
jgi:WD40-like Beta Propeller Repeat